MKKFIVLLLTGVLTFSFAACGGNTETPAQEVSTENEAEVSEESTEVSEESTEASESSEEAGETVAVMSYADYIAAELDTEVVIETYVQAKQSWWDNKATLYTQDEDGAYFIYNMACSEEDYAKLTPGTKIRVTGFKAEWAGEIELAEGATFEIIDGNFVAEAKDVTDLLGTDELIQHQNEFVSFTDMTVEDSGNGTAFMYNWDGSGEDGNDLYFKVSKNGETYTFTVESYLCGAGTDVYEGIKALNIGDTVDLEGFLYWYEGVNPHITAVAVK